MKKFKFTAAATVSCWTEVEAETLEEAKEIAAGRELSDLCYMPYTSEINESWHFENDGMAVDIQHDQD